MSDQERTARKIEITVFDGTVYDLLDPKPDGSLNSLIERLTELREAIPVEHRDEGDVEIWSYEDSVEFIVSYWRDETEEEIAERLDERRRECAAEEARERALFERLRRKYAPPTRKQG